MEATTQCPACGRDCEPNAVICTNCGTDLRTGRPLQASAEQDDAEPAEQLSSGMRILQAIGDVAPGLFSPVVLISAILVGSIGLGVLTLGIVLFLWGALIGACAIGAAGLICYAQAIAMVLYGGFSWLPEMLADLDGPRWTAFFILLFLPIVAIILIARPMAQG
jgi:hypothetical protein